MKEATRKNIYVEPRARAFSEHKLEEIIMHFPALQALSCKPKSMLQQPRL